MLWLSEFWSCVKAAESFGIWFRSFAIAAVELPLASGGSAPCSMADVADVLAGGCPDEEAYHAIAATATTTTAATIYIDAWDAPAGGAGGVTGLGGVGADAGAVPWFIGAGSW